MATKLEIYNLASSAIRGRTIESLTHNTRERLECDKWYELIIRSVQEAAFWPCCKETIVLGGRSNTSDREFTYRYDLPTNFLRAWYTLDYSPFSIESTGGAEKLYSDRTKVTLIYARFNSNPEQWPNELVMGVVYSLAARVAQIFPKNAVNMREILGIAESYIQRAQMTSINASGDNLRLDSDPDWIVARGAAQLQETRFFYPFGQSISRVV